MGKCKVCGVELTPDNAYSRIREAFIPQSYCMACQKERERARYNSNPNPKIKSVLSNYEKKKKFRLKVRVGISRTHLIEFGTYAEKHSFRVLRALQIRYGRCHSSRSSNFNQRVEDLIEITKDGQTYRYYQAAKCDECKAELRYDEHGYKVCTECGLIVGEIVFPKSYPTNRRSHDSRSQIYLGFDYDLDDERPPDERYSTYDRYYSQAYARRLK